MTEFEKGYHTALKEISNPMNVIAENWNPPRCPRCGESYGDFEPCNDGSYIRARSMKRCPFCGQKLNWSCVI